MRAGLVALAWAVAASLPLPAAAGLFDDEEARQQIVQLSKKTDERFDTAARAQLDLARQIEAINAEIAKLRGQLEVLGFAIESAQKRQQDFYIDLDTRLRGIEKRLAEAAAATQANTPPAKAASDPAQEAKDFEAALNLFKVGKYKDALAAFEAFQTAYPDSAQAPSAQFWLGNTHYALRDCKRAIEAQNQVVLKWPTSPKAPDALLAVATCQMETGAAGTARKTLEAIVANYPNTAAAETATQRLKKK